MESSNHLKRGNESTAAASSSRETKAKFTTSGNICTSTTENPILLALGATPRGTKYQIKTWGVADREPSSSSNTEVQMRTTSVVDRGVKSEPDISKRKRQEWIKSDPAHVQFHDRLSEGGEERLSIDPADRSVEHRVSKAVRREIVIASPAGNEEEEWDKSSSSVNREGSPKTSNEDLIHPAFDRQPVDLILHVFSFLVASDSLLSMAQVSVRWRELTNSISLCRNMRSTTSDGSVNWLNFQNLGVKNKGTEGTCFKCRQRSTGKVLAMKRARVFPKGEGVPYYMLRELAVLQGMQHPNLASLEMVSLAKDELHVFFQYVDKTLHEIINPTSDPNGGNVLPERQTRRFLHQLLDAIAYCHRRGVLHRNLKPKHLLIHAEDPNNLDNATLQISDFALVRATGLPRRSYTVEVVTLWYRPPEILMGVRGYSPAVDIWSIGCIFAEMAQGRPLFTGISEIDQLFQIFSKLSTPTKENWPEFQTLPNYRFEFPNWKPRPLSKVFPGISDLGLDLLSRLLTYNPDTRITAEDALRHPYFSGGSTGPMRCMYPVVSMEEMTFGYRRIVADGAPKEDILLYHQYLRESEIKFCRDIDYLSRQRTLRPVHRAMLVDWLIEVVDVFEMCLRTAFLAVGYTDRFLDTVMVKKNKFQLLGATCLHVASKCEDVSYIGVEDLAMCADNVYTSLEVLKMEEKLLTTLDFYLAIPTSLDFLNVYQASLPPIEKKTFMLAMYFCELALQEYQFLKFSPSLVAVCCLSLAMYCTQEISWNKSLEDVSGYKWDDLKNCMRELQAMYSSARYPSLTVVKKRYSKEERCSVALLLPPTRYTMAWST